MGASCCAESYRVRIGGRGVSAAADHLNRGLRGEQGLRHRCLRRSTTWIGDGGQQAPRRMCLARPTLAIPGLRSGERERPGLSPRPFV